MALRGDICQHFNSTVFRYYLRKKYKNHKTFAKRMGVSFQSVYAWSNGDKNPTWKHLIQMAKIFGIPARNLIVKDKQYILDVWTDHLMDYLLSPPEVVNETKDEILGETERHSVKKTKRKLKLTEKGAIDLTEKLGIFEGAADNTDDDIDERSDTLNEQTNDLMFGNDNEPED